MDKLAKRVLKVLRHHKGESCPVTANTISRKLNIPEREIRRIIADLVTNEKMLIASSVHPPYGFYLIRNIKELKKCLSQYYSRLKKLQERASRLYKSGLKKFSKDIQNEFKFK